MRLGWLADPGNAIIGGGELSAAHLAAHAPDWAQIIPCPTGRVADCDAYVVQNCRTYTMADSARLEGKGFVLCVRDYWEHSPGPFRTWALSHAWCVIFDSEPHRAAFPFTGYRASELCPPPVELDLFRAAAKASTHRAGTLWLGQMQPHKGLDAAVAWAREHGPVDFYGAGPSIPAPEPMVRLCGQVPHEQVPETMARYERFLFMPTWVEPYGKTVIEAWAAGCRLEVHGEIGALWWLERSPQSIPRATERFWRLVEGHIG